MGLLDYLFSFRGRINRAKFWAYYLVQFGAFFVVIAAFEAARAFDVRFNGVESPLDPRFLALAVLAAAIWLPLVYARLATFVKRLHDRNKSAWWLALFYGPTLLLFAILPFTIAYQGKPAGFPPILPLLFVPAWIFQFWGFVEMHFFRGTEGDNRYGPDPLAGPV